MNNITVSTTERNMRYKNGVIHNLLSFPDPLAPWIGKSSFDVLLETNDKRNGDLTDFIALIDALPELKNLLELKEGNDNAITLFVPNNDALALLSPIFTVLGHQGFNSTLQHLLLLNHFVSGNFATTSWWTIPTGTKVNNAERLDSLAGNELLVTIN